VAGLTFGAASSLGVGLILEGIQDLCYCGMIYYNREFKLSIFLTLKTVSLVTTFLSFGLSSLS
jgi:hypothetical protein